MGLPHDRNQSYAPSTAVASQDMNDLQDWEVRGWDAIAGKDVAIAEEYLTSLTTNPLVQLAGAATAWGDDSAADGFGVLAIPPGAGSHETWDSLLLPLSGRRWRVTMRVRWAAVPASVNSYCFFGVYTSVGPKVFYFTVTGAGGAVWKFHTVAGDVASTVSLGTGYHTMELRCDGANIDACIDGSVVSTVAVPAIFNAKIHVDVFRHGADGACQLNIDCLKLWVAR